MRFFTVAAIFLSVCSVSMTAHAQSPEAVARCQAQPIQFQHLCFDAIRPKPQAQPAPPPKQQTINDGVERSNPYRFTISTTGGVRPTIRGTANLPDGTELRIDIKKPWLPDAQRRLAAGLAACEDNCVPARSEREAAGDPSYTVVKNGRFTEGPFSFPIDANRLRPFRPGTYPVEIFVRWVPRAHCDRRRPWPGMPDRSAECEEEWNREMDSLSKYPAYVSKIQVQE